MKMKRMLSLMLALVLALGVWGGGALGVAADGSAQVVLEKNVNMVPGGTCVVKMNFSGTLIGSSGFEGVVTYDKTALKLVKVEDLGSPNPAYPDMANPWEWHAFLEKNPNVPNPPNPIGWIGARISYTTKTTVLNNTCVALLTFQSIAATGGTYDIGLSNVLVTNDVKDGDFTEIPATVTAGSIVIKAQDWTAYDANKNSIDTINRSLYTPASLAAYDSAKQAVTELNRADTTLTQSQIDAAAASMKNALDKLVKIVPLEGIGFDQPAVSVQIGDPAKQLNVVFNPANTTEGAGLTWNSSNPAVATVDANGKITAVAPGTTTITVTSADGSFSATCTVTVTGVTAIVITGAPSSMIMGKTATLTAKLTPSNSTQAVTWSSSNTAVATVSNKGVVTAKGSGTVTITAKAGDKSATTGTITVYRYVSLRIGYTRAIRNTIQTTIDDQGTAPYTSSTRTMVPLRFVATQMGGSVKYVNASSPILMYYGNKRVEFKLNSKVMTIYENDKKIGTEELQVAATLKGGRTYIPLRAIAQALGFQVYYDATSKVIVVNNPNISTTIRNNLITEAKGYITK